MNGAAHTPQGLVAGLVLSESVSRPDRSRETVFDASPHDVRAPALVAANRDDRCDVAPPREAANIARAMSNAAGVRIIEVSGGIDRSKRSCGSLTPHGYYGIEQTVVGAIADWMDRVTGHAQPK